jgi:hypothetical protein
MPITNRLFNEDRDQDQTILAAETVRSTFQALQTFLTIILGDFKHFALITASEQRAVKADTAHVETDSLN